MFGSSHSGGSLHSLTVQVIVVVPIGYGSFTGRLSLRTPCNDALVPVKSGLSTGTVASVSVPLRVAVKSPWQVMVGAAVCTTVIVKLQLPPPVLEVAFTTVEPTWKNVPEAGLIVTVPQLPKASALPNVAKVPGFPP